MGARSASHGGKRELVECLFDAGADGTGHHNARRNSALYAAVHNSHIDVVKYILDKCPITIQVIKKKKKKIRLNHFKFLGFFCVYIANNNRTMVSVACSLH